MTYPRNLVSAAWLVQHLDDPQVVVIDCRFALTDSHQGRQQYAQDHVPGAWYVDLNEDLSGPVQRHGGRHPLPPTEAVTTLLTAMGVVSKGSESTLVVAYDDSKFAFASRLWWLLRYLGHDNVAVLDGGWGGWVQSGNPVTTVRPEAQPGNFIPAQHHNWVVDIDRVRRRSPGSMLVDSRSPERYRGEVEPIDPIAGSIPGAVNFFWQDVSDAACQMRSPEQLAAHWADLDSADEVIVYCGSGVTACVNLLSQTLAGRPMAKLYAGGWSDWCAYLE